MTPALIGLGEIGPLLPLIALWIAILVWLSKDGGSRRLRLLVLGAMAVLTISLTVYIVETLSRGPDTAHIESAPQPSGWTLARNARLQVPPSGQTPLVYAVERPCSLSVDAVEVLGKNIEFRVLQDGHSIYGSGIHPGKAVGIVPIAQGTVTIALVNDNLLESKDVQLNVIATLR